LKQNCPHLRDVSLSPLTRYSQQLLVLLPTNVCLF
jgi:hypothetical protein